MRLGRAPHDPIQVSRAPRISCVGIPNLDHSKDFAPILANNDTLPTCTIAGLLNGALASEFVATAGGLSIKDNCWLDFYAACAGCSVQDIDKTDGLVMLDVLKRQGTLGFNIGLPDPLSGDFGTVALDRTSISTALSYLNWLYVGIDLYQADMDSPYYLKYQPIPSPLIGGHCICLWDYTGLSDQDTVRAASWGEFIEITWARWDQITQEAYGVVYPMTQRAGIDLVALPGGLNPSPTRLILWV